MIASVRFSARFMVCKIRGIKSGMKVFIVLKKPFVFFIPSRMTCVFTIADASSRRSGIKRNTSKKNNKIFFVGICKSFKGINTSSKPSMISVSVLVYIKTDNAISAFIKCKKVFMQSAIFVLLILSVHLEKDRKSVV